MRTGESSEQDSTRGRVMTMTDGRARVLVVDDSAAYRRAVAELMATAECFELVGEACCGREALALVRDLRPDFVLVDVRMEELDGVETARLIAQERPETVVVLMSALPAPARLGQEPVPIPFVCKNALTAAGLCELWHARRRSRTASALVPAPAQ